jgi:hypothetical protein
MLISIPEIQRRIIQHVENVKILTKPQKEIWEEIVRWLTIQNSELYQIDKLPALKVLENEKAVILYCDGELFEYLRETFSKGIEDLNPITVLKMYKKLKSIMEKDKT